MIVLKLGVDIFPVRQKTGPALTLKVGRAAPSCLVHGLDANGKHVLFENNFWVFCRRHNIDRT
jgi:hypothetical protein